MSGDEEQLLGTLKRVGVVLKEARVSFALAGGYALYARGGPSSGHDVDFVLRRDDAPKALEALEKEGLRVEKPTEDWLVKVYDGEELVDLIFEIAGHPVDAEMLDNASEVEVGSVRMPVLDVTDVIASKLLVLNDHYCNFESLIPPVRALREQVKWDRLAQRTAESPYARAFLVLMRELDIAPDEADPDAYPAAERQAEQGTPS